MLIKSRVQKKRKKQGYNLNLTLNMKSSTAKQLYYALLIIDPYIDHNYILVLTLTTHLKLSININYS